MVTVPRAGSHVRKLTAIAAADWAIALSLVIGNVQRGIALPLLAASIGTMATLWGVTVHRRMLGARLECSWVW
jgi:hypothetical protein